MKGHNGSRCSDWRKKIPHGERWKEEGEEGVGASCRAQSMTS